MPFAFKLPNLYLSGMHCVSLEPDYECSLSIFLPPTPCFYLPWRESCTIWWKKIARMEREGEAPLLRSQSADLLYSREKNELTLLEADVDTVSVIEDGKS